LDRADGEPDSEQTGTIDIGQVGTGAGAFAAVLGRFGFTALGGLFVFAAFG
jgi:hypothetical protein